MKQRNVRVFSATFVFLIVAGCSNTSPDEQQSVAGDTTIEQPFSLGRVLTIDVAGVSLTSLPDASASGSTASQALGRLLFWDPVLSGDRDIACATCHLPEFGYADGRERSIGTGGVGSGPTRTAGQQEQTPRNAQSVLNTAWNGINEFGLFTPDTAPMFWDNRVQSLALQAVEPIRSQLEMRGSNFSESDIESEIINRLANNAEYQQLFEQAFTGERITTALIGQALADYQSTLVANNSPFDQWMRGDATAMNQQELNGMQVFAETGCGECHSGPMFSDFEPHVLGVREANDLTTPDAGNGNFAFRTPTLRQLIFTAPYFHGGQEATLDEVIDFYDNPNNSRNPNVQRNQLDPDFLALPNLNNNQSNALEAFLRALSDSDFDRSRPASVPSGLAVGGAL